MTVLVPYDATWRVLTGVNVADSFDRTNDATSLGTADTGQVWVPRGATWGINGNKAYLPSPVNHVAAYLDVGQADGTFECDVLFRDAGDGIMFRALGAAVDDGFLVYLDSSALNVLVPGFGAHVTGSPVSTAHSPGTTYRLRVVLSGSSISVYENGTLKVSSSNGTQATATKVGLRSGGTTASKRWDALTFHGGPLPLQSTLVDDPLGIAPSAYDDSAWAEEPGAFGDYGSATGLTVPHSYTSLGANGPVTIQTHIGINGEAYYRKHVGALGGVTVRGWVDNWIWVFVNGTLECYHENFSGSDGDWEFPFTFTDPDNVIAIRSRSTGDEPSGGHLMAVSVFSTEDWHVGVKSGAGWA